MKKIRVSVWLAELETMCRARQCRVAKLMRLTLFTVIFPSGGEGTFFFSTSWKVRGEVYAVEMGSDVPLPNFNKCIITLS